MLSLRSRRTVAVLSCSLAASALAGCGSSDDKGGSSSAPAANGGDGVALLNAATLTPDGAPLKSATVGLTVSGTIDDPSDKDIKKLDGKVALTVSGEQLDAGKSIPPVTVKFDVDGNYTSGSGKSGSGKYAGGITYLNDQLYVNWKGKDYAFGQELTKQFAQGFSEGFSKEAGSTEDLKKATADPKKLLETLDLEPGTWLDEAKVSDGPMLDGVATDAVSGSINVKATAEDLRDGFKKLPNAFPNVPGFKDLEKMGELKDSDIKKAEESLTKRDLTVYIGKEDHVIRRLKLDVAGKDDSSKGASADLSIQLDMSKINQAQNIAAPKSPAPVTDLFMALQQDFPSIGKLLGGG